MLLLLVFFFCLTLITNNQFNLKAVLTIERTVGIIEGNRKRSGREKEREFWN